MIKLEKAERLAYAYPLNQKDKSKCHPYSSCGGSWGSSWQAQLKASLGITCSHRSNPAHGNHALNKQVSNLASFLVAKYNLSYFLGIKCRNQNWRRRYRQMQALKQQVYHFLQRAVEVPSKPPNVGNVHCLATLRDSEWSWLSSMMLCF